MPRFDPGSRGATSVDRPGMLLCGVSERLDRSGVEAVAERHGVGDGVRGEELQGDRDVAEREVEVDQADAVASTLGEGHGEVRRQRGLAAPTLGREDRDQDAVVELCPRSAPLRGLSRAATARAP